MEMWNEVRHRVLVEGASKRSIRREYQSGELTECLGRRSIRRRDSRSPTGRARRDDRARHGWRYLRSRARSSLSTAIVRSAQGFATGMSGNLDEALGLFAHAEKVIPDSGWLHYWRARLRAEMRW